MEAREEIRQNNKVILRSSDGISISIIFRNLTGKNFCGKEYEDYIKWTAIKDMGFEYGEIEYFANGNLKENGKIKFAKTDS